MDALERLKASLNQYETLRERDDRSALGFCAHECVRRARALVKELEAMPPKIEAMPPKIEAMPPKIEVRQEFRDMDPDRVAAEFMRSLGEAARKSFDRALAASTESVIIEGEPGRETYRLLHDEAPEHPSVDDNEFSVALVARPPDGGGWRLHSTVLRAESLVGVWYRPKKR